MLKAILVCCILLQYTIADKYPLNLGIADVSTIIILHSQPGELTVPTARVKFPLLHAYIDNKVENDGGCLNVNHIPLSNVWSIGWQQQIFLFPFVDIYQPQVVGFEFYSNTGCTQTDLVRRVDLTPGNKYSYSAQEVKLLWDLTLGDLPLQLQNGLGSIKLLFGINENIGHRFVGVDASGTIYNADSAWSTMVGFTSAVQVRDAPAGQENKLFNVVANSHNELLQRTALGMTNCITVAEEARFDSLHSMDYSEVMAAEFLGDVFDPIDYPSPILGWTLYNSPGCVDYKETLLINEQVYEVQYNYYTWADSTMDMSVFDGVKSVEAIMNPAQVPVIQPPYNSPSTDAGSDLGPDEHPDELDTNMGNIIESSG